ELAANAVLVSGYAKAPEGTPLNNTYGLIGVVLAVDPVTHTIVDAEFLLLTALAQQFLKDLAVGYNLSEGIDPLLQRIEKHYWAPSQRALVMSLRTAYNRYA